eukprot:jgi/Phyca11/111600/e_gw1.20.180.1
MNSVQLAQFWNEGYVIGRAEIPDDTLNDALEEVSSLDFNPIFGDIYDESQQGDPNRLQAHIQVLGDATKKVHLTVKHVLEITEEEWRVKKTSWNALKALPGGSRQAPHKDYPTFETAQALLCYNHVPQNCKFLFSINNDTDPYCHMTPIHTVM